MTLFMIHYFLGGAMPAGKIILVAEGQPNLFKRSISEPNPQSKRPKKSPNPVFNEPNSPSESASEPDKEMDESDEMNPVPPNSSGGTTSTSTSQTVDKISTSQTEDKVVSIKNRFIHRLLIQISLFVSSL